MAIFSSIGQVAICVENMPRAIEFYRDKLEFPFLFEATGMAFFRCGDMRLMLTTEKPAGANYSSILYYRSENVQQTVNALEHRGVVFEEQPRMIAKMRDHDLWIGSFRDTEGNLLGVMSEVR